ncbi:tetratricopeptide repeat protein [Chryseolinea sp. H1M3-3]|uniref:tetratricopeptide repeat protein n=1 Tax=Chryseolinea sp. H1M3-3 TaxID=3034144 RepID=UPI0023ECB63D|nr:tetratricopeptide repeat protein [Chryseolinea sp. H1M3-3]
MKNIPLLALIIFCAQSCSERKIDITHFEDYRPYLSSHRLVENDPIQEEVAFWTKRLKQNKNDEASLVKLAALHADLFKLTGLANHILLSDSLLKVVLKKYPGGNVEIYHQLSANAISQHRFRESKSFAEEALRLGDKKATSLLQLVDASMEIGNYANANQILRNFKNKNSFAYLIRNAKLHDHNGRLDSAITCMEKAYQRVKGNKSLAQWTLSNLGDMYGHAGDIKKSYETYLEVLKHNPNDDYVLKGIAWIAISYDHNLKTAKAIINALAERKRTPELQLMLAEIAEMEGNEFAKLQHLKKFKALVGQPEYKEMYHKYLVLLEAEEFNNAYAAAEIAKAEVLERPAPQSYDLLAWSYYHQRKFKDALDIAARKVENQTYEPEAIYHLATIYKANGNTEKARHYFTMALESEFELGPSTAKKISAALEQL